MKKIVTVLGVLGIFALVLSLWLRALPTPATAQGPDNNGAKIFLPLVFSNYPRIQPKDYTIRLKSRTFTPQPGLGLGLVAQLQDRPPGRTHVLIQFTRIPTAREREALEENGVKLLAYIPNLAWFASIPSDQSRALQTLELESARWLGSILPEDRIDPSLLANGAGEWARNPDGTVKVKVTFFADVARDEARRVIDQVGGKVESEFITSTSFWISIDPTRIRALTEQDEVQFVGFYPPPPTTINDGSTARTRADNVQALGITGAGVVVGLWDGNEVDDAHDDLTGRVVFGEVPRTGITRQHSTHVACTMAGDGSASLADPALPDLSGYAPGAPTIVSYDFSGNVPNEYAQALTDHAIQVANNSWGRTIGWRRGGFNDNHNLFGAYTLNAPEYDAFVHDDGLTIVWAAGNERDDPVNCCTIPTDGPGSDPAQPPDWDQGMGNNGYDTLGPRSTAKNVIAVGAIIDGNDGMSNFSSWGPTDDGRVKPDVVAPGVSIQSCDDDANDSDPGDIDDRYVRISGTSMAAPAVSGSAALIIEQYNQTFGTDPLPSTIKALLINEAVDLLDNPHTAVNDNLAGPDFIYGWGRIDVLASINRVRNEEVIEGSLNDGDPPDTYLLNVLAGTPRLRVAIAWDDEPAAENAAPALVNDLDLVLIDPNGVSHFPWVLDPGNPNTPATTGVDSTNNVEQVEVDNPIPGVWRVWVSPSLVPEGPQTYSLVPHQVPVDLSIAKSDAPDPVIAGNNLTYTIDVTNNSPADDAADVTVIDTLPIQVSHVSDSGGCSQAPIGTLNCELGDLEAGGSTQFDITVTVDPGTVCDAGGPVTISNAVEVFSTNPDPNLTDNTVSEDTLVNAETDLEIAKSDFPDPAVAGEQLEYTLRVTNHGPSSACGVQVVDTLPAGVTYVSNNAGCVEGPVGTLTCDLGGLLVDEPREVSINVLIDADLVHNAGGPTTITNQASVASTITSDPDPSNNTATEDTLVIAAADLEILSFEAVDPPAEVLVSEPVDITLRKIITNNGPSAPMDVELTQMATAPADSTVTPTSSTTQELALALNEQRRVLENFRINCGQASRHSFTFANQIQPLRAEDTDPDLSNNEAQLTLELECVVPVAIDIRPKQINLNGNGVVSVLVFNNEAGEYGLPLAFDASTIDPLSVRFGPRDVTWFETGGAAEAHDQGHGHGQGLMLHFVGSESGLTAGDTEACVKGKWTDADGNTHRFFGCDEVTVR